MSEAPRGKQPEKNGPDGPRRDPGSTSDRLADALERLAFKLHDLGNWLLGFMR